MVVHRNRSELQQSHNRCVKFRLTSVVRKERRVVWCDICGFPQPNMFVYFLTVWHRSLCCYTSYKHGQINVDFSAALLNWRLAWSDTLLHCVCLQILLCIVLFSCVCLHALFSGYIPVHLYPVQRLSCYPFHIMTCLMFGININTRWISTGRRWHQPRPFIYYSFF